MKAFLITITGENSYPEGAVVLKGSEKKEDQKDKYLVISLFTNEKYTVEEYVGEQDQAIRSRRFCEEIRVNDQAWELAINYNKAVVHYHPKLNENVLKIDLDNALG